MTFVTTAVAAHTRKHMVTSHSAAQGLRPTTAAGSATNVMMGPTYIHLHVTASASTW